LLHSYPAHQQPNPTRAIPARALIVSADMGEGHNATGRALDEAAATQWPGVVTRWVDTLDVMGRGVGPLFRQIYVANVERTPWLYEFFYDSLCRMPWFASASKSFVGIWAGPRLARQVAEFQPDVVLSTYPLGTAGLAWLRRHGKLDVPVGAWVSDFAPHPFWVYRDIDLNLVMHPVAVAKAAEWVPGAPVAVSAPPVVGRFGPGDRLDARRHLDLAPDAFLAFVSCGSLGFGSVGSAVATLLAADPRVHVVVACGRNAALRASLLADGDHDGRLRALGWTDQMPALTVASDVVVTNAGGATSLEALACGRAVLMYRPIAAHGRANAELMAAAGLAEVCEDERELTAAVRRLLDQPDTLATMERAALDNAEEQQVGDGLDALLDRAERDRAPEVRRLRPEDALFVHVQNDQVPQVIGAVLVLGNKADGSPPTWEDAVYLMDAAPGLHGWIDPGSAWHGPSWRADPSITTADVVEESWLDRPADLSTVMDDFFSTPLPVLAGRIRAGEARLVHGFEPYGPDNARSALLLKLHHATADGIAVIGALVNRTRDKPFIVEHPDQPIGPRGFKARLADTGELVRGLVALASAGRATPSLLNGPVSSGARHHAVVDLPLAQLRAAARGFHCTTTDLATSLVADALHRVLHEHGPGPERLRVMMPRSTRTTSTFRTAGNRTGAASVDLAVGPMPLAERVADTVSATSRQIASSAPHAAHAVVRVLGLLPPWLHAILARWVYRSTWFNAIASVLPAARSAVILRGSRIGPVYPVLALAPGVRLSIGVMTWGDDLTVCVSGDAGIGGTIDGLGEAIRVAFKEMRTAHS
jgi:UDP-N-acetylglucosamine:LPS N-acetylglucosamine transferase